MQPVLPLVGTGLESRDADHLVYHLTKLVYYLTPGNTCGERFPGIFHKG
ncbi:MAG: hypothetical protein KAW12_01560 [Candidatus Aminicenantes bacterium]|nr:hypothetical protein [Candidatus Aminicenantes bacterium]